MLAALRAAADPLADEAIAEFIAHHDLVSPRSVMEQLVRTMAPNADDALTPRLADFFAAGHEALPTWIDEEQLRAGRRFFEDWGLPISTALFCASLPTAYLSGNGAQVIRITGELVSSTHRRVAETAQLIVAVLNLDRDDGPAAHPLAPATAGFNAARGVRLMHAAVRAFIRADSEAAQQFEETVSGAPVNQEDLLGTLLTFTTVVFDALDAMGIAVSHEDRCGYLHTWCVVGHLLGIQPDLLPLDYDEAVALDAMIRQRQQQPSEAGRVLMAALRSEMQRNMPLGLRRFPDALVHEFLGTDAAVALGVPRPNCTRSLVWLSQRGGRLWSTAPGTHIRKVVARFVGKRVIQGYVEQGRSGERPPWDYGDYVESWKLRRRRFLRTRRRLRRRTFA